MENGADSTGIGIEPLRLTGGGIEPNGSIVGVLRQMGVLTGGSVEPDGSIDRWEALGVGTKECGGVSKKRIESDKCRSARAVE